MIRIIPLSQDQVTVVDEETFESLSQHRWHLTSAGYAARWAPAPASREMILMHRQIIDAAKGQLVDHIDGDRLNNRRANLRIATPSQNTINQHREKTNGFRGVSWNRQLKKWCASIHINRRRVAIGYFDDQVQAALLYDSAARELHGEFAVLNFPEIDKGLDWRNAPLDMRSNSTSGYRGVSWHAGVGRWSARVTIGGTRRHLGYFDTAEEAAEAHDEAILSQGGDPRRLNCSTLFGVPVDGL